jgi:hypothetical protein
VCPDIASPMAAMLTSCRRGPDLSDAFATINHTYSPRKRKMHRHVTCAIVRSLPRHHLTLLIDIYPFISLQDTKATSVVINDSKAPFALPFRHR